MGDVEHLKECKSLSVVDLSHNNIEDADVAQVFSQMESIVSFVHEVSLTFSVRLMRLACDQSDGKRRDEERQGLPTNDDAWLCKSTDICVS